MLLAWPLVSSAHVHMKKSDPLKGAHYSVAPEMVQVWFSGKVSAEWSEIHVMDANGNRVDRDEVTHGENRKHIKVGLKPLTSGTYNVKLKVISNDGHRVKGSFSFSVD